MLSLTAPLGKMARWAFGLALLALIPVPAAHAGTVYATGFENPPFSTGNLAGQDGWSVFGSTITTVESFFAYSGSQAVFVNGPGSDGQSGPYHTDSPSGPLIDLSAEIYISSSSTEGGWQFAATGAGLTGFIGGVDLYPDATFPATDDVILITGDFPQVGTIALNVWNNFNFLFNMTSQTYSFYLNGSLVQSGAPFCGNNSGPCNGATVSAYSDSIFDGFGGPPNENDDGFMDNFNLSNAPEPGSLLLFSSGLALLIRRKLAQR